MSAIRIIWKCTKPSNQSHVKLYERLMTQAALDNGMDTAVIRHGIHDTTKVAGKYVRTLPHITGDIMNSKRNVGFALHYNVNRDTLTELSPTQAAPNPELWELKYKDGGFILVDSDDNETSN